MLQGDADPEQHNLEPAPLYLLARELVLAESLGVVP